MSRLSLMAAAALITTDNTGVASFSVKVPGTFNGAAETSTTNGRFVQTLEFWTIDGTEGDYITNMRIEDSDGVIPVPLQPSFPFYPIMLYFADFGAQPPLISGLYLKPGMISLMSPMNGALSQFIASQLYLKADFHTANQTLTGQKAICNVRWGIISPIG